MYQIQLQTWDTVALCWFIVSWLGYTIFADWHFRRSATLMSVSHDWRVVWFTRMLGRDMRMVDIQIIAIVVRSVVFFASTSLLILAGLAAVLGATDTVIELVSTLPHTRGITQEWWELVLLILIAIFVYAFFKFTWSVRQYNHLAYLIGAAPEPDNDDEEEAKRFVEIAAWLSTNATKQFNRGLRAYYFGLAVLPWFIHPLLFIAATTGVVVVLYTREFHSSAMKVLSGVSPLGSRTNSPR